LKPSCGAAPGGAVTENETNNQRLFGTPNASPWVKDGINDYLVHGRGDAVNAGQTGTKASAHYRLTIDAGETKQLRLRHGAPRHYAPAESTSGLFGGNSNWRGPIWFPVNLLLIRALLNLYAFYGPQFTVECPTGSGVQMNLFEVARELARRLTAIFLRDESGKRPVYGGTARFQSDPHWRDLILFYEYFHGDNGAGLGASHQTGWTGLVAPLIQLFSFLDAEVFLENRDSLVYRASAAPPAH
jgi:hypothetical protein